MVICKTFIFSGGAEHSWEEDWRKHDTYRDRSETTFTDFGPFLPPPPSWQLYLIKFAKFIN